MYTRRVIDAPKRILYIEDEAFFLKTVIAKLTDNGFIADSANDGEVGLEMVAKERYDLILLDLTMAKVDGLEVLRRLKENPETENIPVVVLSNRSSNEDQARARELGAAAYMVKVQTMPNQIVRYVSKILNVSYRES